MPFVLPIDELTVEEKLQAMETLWADLSGEKAQFESPAWHRTILEERERRVKAGEEGFVDWETAKKQLRDRLGLA
jgi:hypothetical protein